MEYKSYFRPEEFNPESGVKFGSNNNRIVEQLQTQGTELERNAGIDRQNLQGYNTQTKKFLGDLSKTASDLLFQSAKQEAEKTKADAAVIARQDYLSGKRRDPAFSQRLQAAQTESRGVDEATRSVIAKEPDAQAAVFPLYSNTPWKQAMYTRAIARQMIDNEMASFVQAEIDAKNPKNRADLAGVIAVAEAKFLAKTGISNLRPEFMQELYPSISKAVEPIYKKFGKAIDISNAAAQQQKDILILTETGDLQGFLNSTSISVDKNGEALNMAKAWDRFVEITPTLLFSKQLSAEKYNQLKRQIIPENQPGAGKRYGDFYKNRFQEIEIKLFELTKDERDRKKTIEDDEFGIAERQLIDKLQSGDYTNDDVDEGQAILMERFGGRTSAALENLKKRSTTQQDIDAQSEVAQRLQRSGGLTEDFAKALHPDVPNRAAYIQEGRRNDEVRSQYNNFAEKDKIFKGKISAVSGVLPDGEAFRDPTAGRFYNAMRTRFRQLVAENLALVGPNGKYKTVQDAVKAAENSILVEIDSTIADKNQFDKQAAPSAITGYSDKKGAFIKYRPSVREATDAKKAREEIEAINARIDRGEGNTILDSPDDNTFTREELERIQGNKFIIQTNGKIDYIAKKMGLSPVEVAIRLRRAKGLTAFPGEDKLPKVRNGVSPTNFDYFRNYQTPTSSLRMLGELSQTEPTIVQESIPNNLGEVVKEVSGETTVPFQLLAAVIEAQGWDDYSGERASNIKATANLLLEYIKLDNGDVDKALNRMGDLLDEPDFARRVKRISYKYGGELPLRPNFKP